MRPVLPSPALASAVRRFEVIESAEGMTRTLLPETGLAIGIRYAGNAGLLEGGERRPVPDCSVTGLRSTARQMQTSEGGGVVVVKLREGYAGRFFGASAHELFGQTVALDALVSARAVERVSSDVAGARTDAERTGAIERFLLSIERPFTVDRRIERALRAIAASDGSVRIGELARDAGLSHDAFEKRFRRVVGATPKQWASVVRLRRAVAAYGSGRSLAAVSVDAGYADQSHFNRQFRKVTGRSPRALLASEAYC